MAVISIEEKHQIQPYLFGVFESGSSVHFLNASPEQFDERLAILDEGIAKLLNPTHPTKHCPNILNTFCQALEIEACAVAGAAHYQCLC